MENRIKQLELEISKLEETLQAHKLLQEIYLELGPYTPHLSQGLLIRLQRFFDFDDSE